MKNNQLKLLNFYKALASIATNLVGAFIPLIVYKYTGSLVLALTYVLATSAIRGITAIALKKLMFKYPQLFILLRAIPIVLYSVFMLLIDVNVVVAVIGTGLFVGIASGFANLPNELIHNYSSLNKGSSSLGISVFFEKIGVILAYIAGGLFLDYISQWILILISLLIYLISVIPLIIYFVKNRNMKGFNSEATSNAAVTFAESSDKSEKGRKISKKIILNYFMVYMLYNMFSPLVTFFSLFLFIKNGEFAIIGYLTATYNAAVMILSVFVGKIDQKRDLTLFVWLGFIVTGIGIAIIPFIKITWLWFIIFIIMGLAEAVNHVFILERLRMKTRILGVSNEMLYYRHCAQCTGTSLSTLFCMSFGIIPAFIFMAIASVSCGTYAVLHEEKSRKALVKYLQGNDET